MDEGVATSLIPHHIFRRRAFLTEWARTELGPEARIADEIIRGVRLLRKLPDLIRRIDHYYPPPGAAPPAPPLREIAVVRPHRYGLVALIGLIAAAAGVAVGGYLF